MTFRTRLLALSPIAYWRLGESALAAPTFLAGTNLAPSTTTSFTVTPPSQAPGTCVVVSGSTGINSTVTPPAGWTTVQALDINVGGGQSTAYVFYRVIAAGDPTTWTFTGSTDGTSAFAVAVYDHVDHVEATATNSDVGGAQSSSFAGPTLTAGSLGPYRLVHCVSVANNTSTPNETVDAALTSRATRNVTFFGTVIGDETISSSGTTTARTTTSSLSQTWAAAALLLVGTAVDSSGNGHTGTYVGSPTLGVTGLLTGDADTAVTLGSGKYITTSPSADYNIAHPAFVALIKGTAFGNLQMIASQADGTSNNHWYLCFLTGGKVNFTFTSTAGADQSVDSGTTVVDDNVRHLVVGRWDGSFVDLFVDGVRVGHAASGATPNTGGSIPVTIGAESNGSFTGAVTADEFAYLDAANISDADIAALWLDVIGTMTGTSAGHATATGTLAGPRALAGTAAGAASATGSLTVPKALAGTSAGHASATSTLQAIVMSGPLGVAGSSGVSVDGTLVRVGIPTRILRQREAAREALDPTGLVGAGV